MFVFSVAAWFPDGATLFQPYTSWLWPLTEPCLRYERFEFSKIWLGFHYLPDFSQNRDLVEDITGKC